MTPSERITKVIEHYRLNIDSFTSEIGTGNVTITKIIKEGRKPNAQTFRKIIARFPEINDEWLKTGKGKMFKKMPIEVSNNITSPEALDSNIVVVESVTKKPKHAKKQSKKKKKSTVADISKKNIKKHEELIHKQEKSTITTVSDEPLKYSQENNSEIRRMREMIDKLLGIIEQKEEQVSTLINKIQ